MSGRCKWTKRSLKASIRPTWKSRAPGARLPAIIRKQSGPAKKRTAKGIGSNEKYDQPQKTFDEPAIGTTAGGRCKPKRGCGGYDDPQLDTLPITPTMGTPGTPEPGYDYRLDHHRNYIHSHRYTMNLSEAQLEQRIKELKHAFWFQLVWTILALSHYGFALYVLTTESDHLTGALYIIAGTLFMILAHLTEIISKLEAKNGLG